MNPRRVRAVVLRQFYLMRGSFSRILPVFVWIAVDMVLWGYLTRYLNAVAGARYNFVPALLGAVLLWDFLTRCVHGVTTTFLEDVWSRNFLNVFSSPLSVSEYVLGLVCSSVLTSTIGLCAMLVLASSLFGLSFAQFGLRLVPFVLVLFLFGIALGIFGCALVMRYGPAAEWFVWPIPPLVSPFAGVFYPVAVLPSWMRGISIVLPPSYVFESMRTILAGRSVSWSVLGASTLLALLYVLAAGWVFRYVHHRARETGLIARYSAENAG